MYMGGAPELSSPPPGPSGQKQEEHSGTGGARPPWSPAAIRAPAGVGCRASG